MATCAAEFPVGLRVLVVDHAATTLKIIEQLSIRCRYCVTTCTEATVALNLLRERKDCFDVALIDAHMPDMDGYKLLELVVLEMDLPVIMMSSDSTRSAVMKGITHGACDYLVKPVREEELRNIWQHVVRKIWNENKEHDNSSSMEDSRWKKRGNDDTGYTSVADAAEVVKEPKKKSSLKEEDIELENDDPATSKKPRIVWSVELHRQFVRAVNQLGLDKVAPKRILKLMNVPGLTRENVASHLQKYRLYMKRISGVAHQQNGMLNAVPGTIDSPLGVTGRFDIQALAAAGYVPPETPAAVQTELLGRPETNIMPTVDQTTLLQASIQGPKHPNAEHAVAYGQPLVKCSSNTGKNFPPSILTVNDTSSGYGAWPSSNNAIGSVRSNNSVERVSIQNNMLMDILEQQQRQQHQQKQQQQLQQQQQSLIHDQSCSINVQPFCLVAPGAAKFPAGLRVLVVDDDATTLKIIEQMSIRCRYHVTTCTEATVALNLLRETKGCFDVLLSDVHMPDMDGYKLLEHVGLQMDLPVILMSGDSTTSAVMKGIRHGACDYLIKPVREEELRNIWQHVVRKIWNKEHDNSGSMEDSDWNKRGNDDAEYTSSAADAAEVVKAPKKRSSLQEEDIELESDDPATSKKPRVVWSVELHQQFVSAVNQLGLDKAVPKKILELMNVPGLTRENVASHLQEFRLYLKQISGVAQQQNGMLNAVPGTTESQLGVTGRFDIQALAAADHVPPETPAAVQTELLGRPATNLMPTMDQTTLLQASILGPKHSQAERAVAYGQPLVKHFDIGKNFPPSILTVNDTSSGYGAWPSSNNAAGSVRSNNSVKRVDIQNNNMLMEMLEHQQRQQHQQKQQQQLQQQQQSLIHDQSCSINVQPFCLVVPSQSSDTFQAVNSPASVNQDCSFGRIAIIDYSQLSQKSNNPFSASQFPGVDTKARGVLYDYGYTITTPSTYYYSNYILLGLIVSIMIIISVFIGFYNTPPVL